MTQHKQIQGSIGFFAALVLCRLRNAARIQQDASDEPGDAERGPDAGRDDAKETSHDGFALVL